MWELGLLVLTPCPLPWQDECYNYIKVLVPKDDRTLFACGTNAFNPMCRTYKVRGQGFSCCSWLRALPISPAGW